MLTPHNPSNTTTAPSPADVRSGGSLVSIRHLTPGFPPIPATEAQGVAEAAAAATPEHVVRSVAFLKVKFAVAKDALPWDKEDTRDYSRQFMSLTPKQAAQVRVLLRERHTFRPSVAEVKAVADEIIARDTPPAPKKIVGEGAFVDACRTVFRAPDAEEIALRQIEGNAPDGGPARLRACLQTLAAATGLDAPPMSDATRRKEDERHAKARRERAREFSPQVRANLESEMARVRAVAAAHGDDLEKEVV